MEDLWLDIRYGLRMLGKNRGAVFICILTLALGIGANTAIFSIVNSILLTAPPYLDSDRLVMIWEQNRPRSRDRNVVNPGNFLDWQSRNSVFEQMAGMYDSTLNLTGQGDPEELAAQWISPNMFSMLGVEPLMGRDFMSEDAQEDSGQVVLLSHGLWQRRFGGDLEIIGRSIQLNGQSVAVIGVMPSAFNLFIREMSLTGRQPDLWTPIRSSPNLQARRGRFMRVIGQLKDDLSLQAAQQEMDSIGKALEEQYPDFNSGWGINLVPLHEQLTGDVRPALLILLGAVGLVLLVACANVANLQLARSAVRERELTVRLALGGSPGRIARQLLVENSILAVAGGGLGVAIAAGAVRILPIFLPPNLSELQSAALDETALIFTLVISLVTGALFGLSPVLETKRLDLNQLLKELGRTSALSARRYRASRLLVVSEFALALLLLVGAGLLIRSLWSLQASDPGFDSERVLTARIVLPAVKYREDWQKIQFFRELVERSETLPGVRSAATISFVPFGGPGAATSYLVEGQAPPAPENIPVTDVRVVHENFFKTLDIPLLAGRLFDERDSTSERDVIIVSETFARTTFPGEDPLGKKVLVHMRGDDDRPSEIVGVVGDIRHSSLSEAVRAMVYWPHRQLPYSFMTVMIKADRDPGALAPEFTKMVHSMDPELPVSNVRTMDHLLSGSVAKSRFVTFLLAVFAAVALILASVGVYGVISCFVSQRIHEIGIRTALGAQARDVFRLVMGQGLSLALAGMVIGGAGATILMRSLGDLLFQVEPIDTSTYLAAAICLIAVALLACWLPARRAVRVDPIVTLRSE